MVRFIPPFLGSFILECSRKYTIIGPESHQRRMRKGQGTKLQVSSTRGSSPLLCSKFVVVCVTCDIALYSFDKLYCSVVVSICSFRPHFCLCFWTCSCILRYTYFLSMGNLVIFHYIWYLWQMFIIIFFVANPDNYLCCGCNHGLVHAV